MKELDRTQAPDLFPFGKLCLPLPLKEILPDGTELYIINKGDQEVCRIDLLYEGGRYATHIPAIADLTGPMLRKGIEGMNANEIAEFIDYHGAWLQMSTTLHYSTVSLFSLNRNLAELLPVVVRILTEPTLPEKEFEVLREQRIQQLLVNREKVRILAGEAFNSLIFGKEHPYARINTTEGLQSISVDDLRDYHNRYFLQARKTIILSGYITDTVLSTVRQQLGNLSSGCKTASTAILPIQPENKRITLVDKQGALQSGLRIGMPTIGIKHSDYPLLGLANHILGGYFGSRLMTKIREEKGYTYGISSYMIALRESAYFTIVTEAGCEFTRPLIDEVRNEIQRLCDEPVPQEEFEIARNYMQGRMARVLDSPFSICDYTLSTFISGTSPNYFDIETETLRCATAEDVQRVVRTHLSPDNLYIAIAGDTAKIEM